MPPHFPIDLTNNTGIVATGSVRDRMAKASLNAQERLMLLFDNSGSMADHMPGYTSKMDAAKNAIEGFLAKCDRKTSAVGLITFDTECEMRSEPVQYYQNLVFAAQQMYSRG